MNARLGPFLRSRVDTNDVLQETHVRAWKSLARFRETNQRALTAWLKRIAEHVLVDLAARHRRDEVIYVEEPVDRIAPDVSPSRLLRREERFARLEEALAGLSPEHREALTLVRIKGLRIREAAERMERSPNAVTHLLLRALKKLKESFGDTESLHLPPKTWLDDAGRSDEREGPS